MKLHHVAACGLLLSMPVWAAAEEPAMAPREGVEMTALIERFARRSGKQFVVDPRVRAQVALAGIDANQIDYAQLLTILDVHGFAVAEIGGMLAVMPDVNARQLPAPTYTDARFKGADSELVTLVQQYKKVCAAQMVPVLRPLMPQAAHMAALPSTNTLIINGHAADVRRIANLAQELDSRGTADGANCEDPRKSD